METIKKKIDKRVTATNPPFVKLEDSLFKALDQIGWKDLVPSVLTFLKENQPKDTRYTLEFWADEYKLNRKK